MKTKIILIAMSLFQVIMINAQNAGSIKGRIVDAKTNEPLIGANAYVEIAGTIMGINTDVNGRFTIKPLSPGTYEVNISYIGYAGKKITTTVFPDEMTIMKDIKLSEGILIDGVTVNGNKEVEDVRLIDPMQVGKIAIKSADIENIAGANNITMVLRATNSEVQVSDDGKDIVFRGSRNGSSTCYVDGVKQLDLSSTVPGCIVGSLVMYSGAIPSKYGDVTGGVVVIETKNYFDVRSERRILESKKNDMKKYINNDLF
jgi:hypothetical protein